MPATAIPWRPLSLLLLAAHGSAAAAGNGFVDENDAFPEYAPARQLGADSGRWFKYLHEYRYVEALLVIFFVIVTLTFEITFHYITHMSADSYHYGKLQREAALRAEGHHDDHGHHGAHGGKLQHLKHAKHLQLYKELVNRMGGEFMTLGFLALGIFTFNQSGGFKVMAKYFPACTDMESACFHFPDGGYQWLHMMEVVHVKLFLGMLLYFVFMTFLVNYSVKQIQAWEKVKMRMDHVMTLVSTGSAAEIEENLRFVDSDLDEHILWRDNFIENVLTWQADHKELFEMVANKLKVDVNDPQAGPLVRQKIEGHFSLSSYLALNLEVGVGDSIMVHPPTWMALIATFGFLALLHRFAMVQLRMLTPVIYMLKLLLVMWMWLWSKGKRKGMKNFVDHRHSMTASGSTEADDGHDKAKKQPFIQKNLESIVMKAVQVMMFLVSYVLANALADVDLWQDSPMENLIAALAYSIFFLIFSRITPAVLPGFLAVMAFPPYVSNENLVEFFLVLFDKYDHEGEEPVDLGEETTVEEVMTENERRDTARRSKIRESLTKNGVLAQLNRGSLKANLGGDGQIPPLAAIEELASILGARDELDRRLRRRFHAGEATGEQAQDWSGHNMSRETV